MSAMPLRSAESALVRRDALLNGVTHAADVLSKPTPWESVVDEVLRVVGEATHINRAYIFEVERPAGTELVFQRFEWCSPGVTPQIDNPELQGVPLKEAGFGRWSDLLSEGEPVFGDVEDFPPSERPLLEMQGIKSILVQPIFVGGVWWGFLGLDACETTQSWARYEVDMLRIVSLLLGAAIDRRLHETRLIHSQKQEVLGRMAGGIAHDFNNVLTVINSSMGLLNNNLGPVLARSPGHVECCAIIDKAINRARGLTRRLLDFSKRRSGASQLVSPLDLVNREEPLLRGLLRKSVELRISAGVDQVPSASIRIDPTEFSQLILNLTVNANDAMPNGGVLSFEVATVDSSIPPASSDHIPAGNWILVRVVDTGEGMSPEVLNQAFEPFFTTKADSKGTGLGLATVQGIVAAAGGFIKLSSSLGCGTEFRIYFPAAKSAPPFDTPKKTTTPEP